MLILSHLYIHPYQSPSPRYIFKIAQWPVSICCSKMCTVLYCTVLSTVLHLSATNNIWDQTTGATAVCGVRPGQAWNESQTLDWNVSCWWPEIAGVRDNGVRDGLPHVETAAGDMGSWKLGRCNTRHTHNTCKLELQTKISQTRRVPTCDFRFKTLC